MNSNRERWLQLALVAVCAALEEVECTDDALTEALFVGLPGVKIDDLTAAAVAEALRRSGTLKDAAASLDRSRGFIYDSLKRRRRDWLTADWAAYGAELRRRRLLAGWSAMVVLPWTALDGMALPGGGPSLPPSAGDVLRMTSYRAHHDREGSGADPPAIGWAWSPIGNGNVHVPERWVSVTFSDDVAG